MELISKHRRQRAYRDDCRKKGTGKMPRERWISMEAKGEDEIDRRLRNVWEAKDGVVHSEAMTTNTQLNLEGRLRKTDVRTPDPKVNWDQA